MSTFDATEFNLVASDLLQGPGGSKQCFIRTAVGRSYYSQYGYLRSRIETQCPGTFGTHGWHSQLVQVCVESTSKPLRQVGQHLSHLQLLRREADYVPEKEIAREDAEGAVDVADKLKEKIRNMSADDVFTLQKELQRLIDHVQAGTTRRTW